LLKLALVAAAAVATLWLAVGLAGCSLFGSPTGGSGEGDRVRTERIEP
jgi:hypothetical protein